MCSPLLYLLDFFLSLIRSTDRRVYMPLEFPAMGEERAGELRTEAQQLAPWRVWQVWSIGAILNPSDWRHSTLPNVQLVWCVMHQVMMSCFTLGLSVNTFVFRTLHVCTRVHVDVLSQSEATSQNSFASFYQHLWHTTGRTRQKRQAAMDRRR
jgi:hypothetical protein